MGTPRTRMRTLLNVSPGAYRIYKKSDNSTVYLEQGGSGIGTREQTTDVVMDPPYDEDHPFICVKEGVKSKSLRINGTMPWILNDYEYEFLDYNPPNRSLYQYRPDITPVNWAYWMTKALANMNPNAPLVDVPLLLFECKDFPAMLKNMGDILGKRMSPKAIPEGYLAYSFGWKPLVSDLLSLFDFTEQMRLRILYLKDLEHGGHIRRSLGGGIVQHSITPNGYQIAFSTPSGQPGLSCDVELIERQRVWYTANAKLLDALPASASEVEYLTRGILLGLSVSPQTVWNMIPWSWLVDYMSNIGDFLLANRGGLRFQCTRMNLMCTSTVESRLSNHRVYGNSAVASGGTLYHSVKQRNVYDNPTPWLTFDSILSGAQIANLGALLTAAALKGGRVAS